jgi:hypothetical protein
MDKFDEAYGCKSSPPPPPEPKCEQCIACDASGWTNAPKKIYRPLYCTKPGTNVIENKGCDFDPSSPPVDVYECEKSKAKVKNMEEDSCGNRPYTSRKPRKTAVVMEFNGKIQVCCCYNYDFYKNAAATKTAVPKVTVQNNYCNMPDPSIAKTKCGEDCMQLAPTNKRHHHYAQSNFAPARTAIEAAYGKVDSSSLLKMTADEFDYSYGCKKSPTLNSKDNWYNCQTKWKVTTKSFELDKIRMPVGCTLPVPSIPTFKVEEEDTACKAHEDRRRSSPPPNDLFNCKTGAPLDTREESRDACSNYPYTDKVEAPKKLAAIMPLTVSGKLVVHICCCYFYTANEENGFRGPGDNLCNMLSQDQADNMCQIETGKCTPLKKDKLHAGYAYTHGASRIYLRKKMNEFEREYLTSGPTNPTALKNFQGKDFETAHSCDFK